MTARNSDRLIREFLEEGRNELPDRAYDAVRAQIDHTRQRVFIGPWRFNLMNTYARYAIGAGAVVLVALVGVQLFSNRGIGGTPTPTPTPAPTASPTVAPTSTPVSLHQGDAGALPPGTYLADTPFLVPVTFDLPAAWKANIGGPYAVWLDRIGGPGLSFQIFDKVYADPCNFTKGPISPKPGPSAADLATALASLPNLTASAVTDVSISGHAGKHLTLTAPSTFDYHCSLAPGDVLTQTGLYRLWDLPLGATNDMTTDETQEIWILDVANQRLVIQSSQVARYQNGAFADELQSIVDSIRITPKN